MFSLFDWRCLEKDKETEFSSAEIEMSEERIKMICRVIFAIFVVGSALNGTSHATPFNI